MNFLNCSCCKKQIEEHKAITCVVCKNTFYHACVDLTSSEIRSIRSKKSLSWTCSSCENLGETINALKASILSLKKEVADLTATINAKKETKNTDNFEEIIHEINQRNEKRNNLLFFGIKESPNTTNASDRQEHDKDKIRSVLEFLSPGVNYDEIKPVRLGKHDPSKSTPRPVKIRFVNPETVSDLVRKSKNLRSVARFNGISISFDRTPRQIAAYKSIKTNLDNRIANGEKDLRIKYINGIPKIVSKN